ncbi:DUF211 domain-containing protein [Candidatus Micrarchaeota archaeon]|nr:DUF211 domain-containing protein [Candidatus Micrarchaeota archaeon]
MAAILRLVLDIMVPNNVPLDDLTVKLASVGGAEGVDILVQEVEQKVQTAKLTIEGVNIDFQGIKKVLHDFGASLQSTDRVSAGKRIVG